MVAIVSVETVLLVLLVLLVAALLRSHAEILRRLGPDDGRPKIPEPPAGVRQQTAVPELAGTTPAGDAVKLAFAGTPTLLAFLSSGCTSCAGFWETLGERAVAPGLQTMIVTRGPERERVAKLRSLSPEAVPVIMSSQAWEDYAVPGTPYFVLVKDGEVHGEGVATTWHALSSLVTDAIAEEDAATNAGLGIEERLAAAGIGPEHPSLFPDWSAAPDGGASPGGSA